LSLLELIKLSLGVGEILNQGDEVVFRVGTIKELEAVINHFDKYPLLTQK